MRIRRILCVALAFLIGLAVGFARRSWEKESVNLYGDYSNPAEAAHIRENMKYIIHAAGTLTGTDLDGSTRSYDGSNSFEGMMQCVNAGANVVEIDFNFTSDGKLACIHDWYHQYADEITDNVPLTLEEFRNARIYRNFTPLCLDDIVEFLYYYPDLYIVTDIKDDNLAGLVTIAEEYPDFKNRFLVQTYDESEYDAVRELGFEYVVFTLYRLDWNSKTDWRALGKFAKSHPLIGFTFSYELCDVRGYVEGMKKSGVPLFIHTVNGDEEQQKYFDMGIAGIYTDEVKR